jgi:hypothetical protein
MKLKLARSFDELIKSYYGSGENLFDDPASAEELLAGYYGSPDGRRRAPRRPAAAGLSLSCDDGETLRQRRKSGPARDGASPARPPASLAAPASLTQPDPAVPREFEVDFGPPGAGRALQGADRPSAEPRPASPLPPTASAATRAGGAGTRSAAETGPASGAEDEFAADLKAIMSGQKVFDPVTKQTVDKDRVVERRADQGAGAVPLPAAPSESDAIFNRIAQSLQYANAFDLGTVELQNRFADFDRIAELKRRSAEEKRAKQRAAPPAPAPAKALQPDHKDFIEDLDAIRSQRTGAAPAGLSESQSVPARLSRAMYDTGEHVLAAESLYPDRFLVGKAPGVSFSYGQIIAMADMFESVHQMMAAEAAELKQVKALIEQSTAYYQANKAGSVRDVTSADWQKATGGRYLKLAEDNYDHFAPNFLFKNAPFARAANRYGNHKTAWERHHEWAIQEAQKLFLGQPNANVSYFPEWPLIINAFGDHFLTDAFAAGHVINKEAIIEYYKSSFYQRGSLTADGKAFFRKVAQKAFKGEVARKFSRLETAEPYDAWWNVFDWNPDIDSAERFALVLIGAAEKEPEKIGNLAVKAIHDRLNRDGVEVTNGAGSGTWHLTGDGYLTPQTLSIMRQAVQQSAENITDPGILASNVDIGNYLAKVWKYVPQLTPASEKGVKTLVTAYVSPSSGQLIDAAAAIIHHEVDALIKALVEKGALQPA